MYWAILMVFIFGFLTGSFFGVVLALILINGAPHGPENGIESRKITKPTQLEEWRSRR